MCSEQFRTSPLENARARNVNDLQTRPFRVIKWRGRLSPFACFRLRASTRTRRARFEAPSRLARMLYAVCEFSMFFLSLSWFGHTQASKSVTPRGGEPEGPRARKRSRICIIGRALGRNRALARSSRPGGSRATPWRRAREIDARKRPDREKTLEGVLQIATGKSERAQSAREIIMVGPTQAIKSTRRESRDVRSVTRRPSEVTFERRRIRRPKIEPLVSESAAPCAAVPLAC